MKRRLSDCSLSIFCSSLDFSMCDDDDEIVYSGGVYSFGLKNRNNLSSLENIRFVILYLSWIFFTDLRILK